MYREYLRDSREGVRTALVAEVGRDVAGYVTIVWDSDYPPFREARIAEVVDLNVLGEHQRQGVGTALLEAAEQQVAQRSSRIGIGTGLTADYGAAQKLYVRRGYVPDGRGIYRRGGFVEPGETITIDDSVVLHLVKKLGQA